MGKSAATILGNTSISINGIARRLGVDPLTVKRHAQRLKLPMTRTKRDKGAISPPQKASIEGYISEITHETRMERRDIWLKACKTHGHLGRKAVRQQVAREYTWLYRHDRDWLQQNLPPKTRPEPKQRVNWGARDEKIAHLIPVAAQQLQSQSGPPCQLTKAAIGRAIGCAAMIEQHLDLLPLTAIALAQVEESRIAFAIRRIQWASAFFENQARVPERWELVRLAGVGRLLSDIVIQKALDVAVNGLKQLLELH